MDAFLRFIPDDARRQDCLRLLEIMKSVTGDEPKLWGAGMVGFGSYHTGTRAAVRGTVS